MLDIKLNKDKDYWDIDFENGDFALTNSIDTALYMSIFCEKQATASQVSDPLLRRGHFTNLFYEKELGSFLWFYTYQHSLTDITMQNARKTINESLQWLINDKFVSSVEVNVSKQNNTLNAEIALTGSQENTRYYNLTIV
jgi:phage gp46-like protein